MLNLCTDHCRLTRSHDFPTGRVVVEGGSSTPGFGPGHKNNTLSIYCEATTFFTSQRGRFGVTVTAFGVSRKLL